MKASESIKEQGRLGLHTEALPDYISGRGKAGGTVVSSFVRAKDLFLVFMKCIYSARLKIGSPNEVPQGLAL